MRRPLAIKLKVRPWRSFELPLVEPQLLSGAVIRFGVKGAIVRHDALEAVGVAHDPVDHPSAETRTQSALTLLIDKRIVLLGVVQSLHQVVIRSAAPVAINRVNELLPIAGRAVKVDFD